MTGTQSPSAIVALRSPSPGALRKRSTARSEAAPATSASVNRTEYTDVETTIPRASLSREPEAFQIDDDLLIAERGIGGDAHRERRDDRFLDQAAQGPRAHPRIEAAL